MQVNVSHVWQRFIRQGNGVLVPFDKGLVGRERGELAKLFKPKRKEGKKTSLTLLWIYVSAASVNAAANSLSKSCSLYQAPPVIDLEGSSS